MLIALILFTLLIFAAMATNMGILVNDKVRMQNTADLATYAAAYKEAVVLNDLTDINQNIANTVATCRQTLVTGVWATCTPSCDIRDPLAEAVIMGCQATLDALITQFITTAMWTSSVQPALDSGKTTADRNFSGTDSNTSFMEMLPGSPTFPMSYFVDYTYNLMGVGFPIPAIANITQATVTLNYMRIITCPVCEGVCCPVGVYFPETDVYAWFYKENDRPEVWVEGRVYGTPLKQYLDIDAVSQGYFGGSSTGNDDILYAYAVAKPYEGSIGPTRMSSVDQNGDWLMGPFYMPGPTGYTLDPRRELGMVPEYRARFASLNDPLEGGAAPTDLAMMDGFMLGKFWNTAYFAH